MLLEPVTSLTDVILCAMTLIIAWYTYRNAPRPLAARDGYWLGSFLALTVATGLGAVIHGVALGQWHFPVWAAIRFWTSVSEVCFFMGAVYTVFGNRTARRAAPLLLAGFASLFTALVLTRDAFMLFEAIGIGGATLLFVYHFAAMSQVRSLSLPAASVFFAVGAVLQAGQAEFRLIWTFNGDDIFHLALMGALVCIAVAAHPSIIPLDGPEPERPYRPIRLPLLSPAPRLDASLPQRAIQALVDRWPSGHDRDGAGPSPRG
ncbi:MAG: hypothetical protein NTZ05_02410 [Chloroflexi bacterium]|nr:hypothetical protein [Chloroflexota bacterium]